MIKRIVVALPDDEKLLPALYDWGARFDWTHVEEVHFLHIVKKIITNLEFGIVEMPDEETYQDMIPTLDQFMRDESQKIIPFNFSGKTYYHLKKDFDPEEETEKILKALNADLVVVSPQDRHGFTSLFHRSFTNFMLKHSPCDVYIAKAEHTPRP